MPNPSTATVTAGPVLDFFGGAPAALTVEVVPVLGDTASHLVHAESGTAMAAYRRSFESDPVTGAVSFTLPHVDAPGWLDETGRTVTFWKYTARVTAVFDGDKTRRLSWRKEIQPLTGQASIDLELVPNGQTAEQFVTPGARVTSVNGQTGAVVIPPDQLGRVDTTAGTRIYVPTAGGGETRVYADTGWREIKTLITSGTIESLLLRRENSAVYLDIINWTTPITGNNTLVTLPAGYRPTFNGYHAGSYGPLRQFRSYFAGRDGGISINNANATEMHATRLVWSTRDSWPSTLPGQPF